MVTIEAQRKTPSTQVGASDLLLLFSGREASTGGSGVTEPVVMFSVYLVGPGFCEFVGSLVLWSTDKIATPS